MTAAPESEGGADGRQTVALRQIIPAELLQRDAGCPFDPAPGLLERRGGGPVHELTLGNGARAWLVTGFDEARQILADPRFSNDRFRYRDATQPTTPAPTGRRTDGMFLFMDPPEHTRLRRLLTGQFTVRRMKALEPRITEIAIDHIEAMRSAGTTADLVPAYALPIPSLVICELLGVDYAERDAFQRNTAIALDSSAPDEDRNRARGELYRFMAGLVAAKRARPGDDLLSGLIEQTESPLTDRELIDISVILLGAGHETTANMLALGTYALLENPGQLAALRADPALMDQAIEELLRYLSIIQLGVTRVATEPVTIGGVEIPSGATVILGVPEINRDDRHWADADRLDLARARGPHLAFGHGVHQCLGQQLARAEMRIGFAELFARLPGLRLAVPAKDVPLRNDMLIFGVHSLPVTWA